MQTKSKTVNEPGRYLTIPVIGVSVNGSPIDYPTGANVVVAIPGFRSYFEKLRTKDANIKGKDWYNCEHYKSAQVLPFQAVGGIRTVVGKWVDSMSPNFHYGIVQDPLFGYMGYAVDGTLEWFGNAGSLDNWLPTWYAEEWDGSFVTPPTWLGSMVSASLKAMLPEIKPQLSLLNSIIELKDFKGLLHAVTRIAKAPSMIRSLAKTVRDETVLGSGSLRDLSRRSSDDYLKWKFALAPLVSDVSGVYTALSQFEKQLNAFLTRAGTLTKRHWTKSVLEDPAYRFDSDVPHSIVEFYYSGLNSYSTHRRVYTDPVVFHAEIQYDYNYTEYQLEHARVLALLDAFGVNLNPAIIWNAIPWTFVVDWVFGVGQWLNNFKVSNMKPQINIRRFLYSFKRNRRILCTNTEVSPGKPAAYPLIGSSNMPTVQQSAYRRYVGLPSRSSIESSGLTPTEYSLGVALVLARRRPPRKTQNLRDIKSRLLKFPPLIPKG